MPFTINKAADAQVKSLEKIKNKWQEVIDQQEYAKNVTLLTGEFGADAITKILTGNDDDLLAQWKNSYINTLQNIDMETQGYIGDMTRQITSLYKDSANAMSSVLEKAVGNISVNTVQNNVNTIDKPIVTADGHTLRPIQPGDRAWDLQKAFEPMVDKILKGEMDIISNAYFEHQKQFEKWTKEITNNTAISNITNNRNVQPITINQNVTLNCPNLTNNSGIEYVDKQLGHLSQRALQEAYKR